MAASSTSPPMITSGGGALANASASRYCSRQRGHRTSARGVARGGTVTSSRHRGQRTMVISASEFDVRERPQVYFPRRTDRHLLTTHLLTTHGVPVQSPVSPPNCS